MRQVDVTWTRALKVYWSLSWRILLYTLVPVAILAAALYRADQAGLLEAAGVPQRDLAIALSLTGLTVLLLMPACIVKCVLSRAYSDFRIVLQGTPPRFKIEPQLRERPSPPGTPKRQSKRSGPDRREPRVEPTFVHENAEIPRTAARARS